MYPSLGELFGAPLSAYFTFLLLGFALGLVPVARWARRRGLPSASIFDAALAALIGGVIGGRLLHVLADGYFWDYVHLCTDPARVGFRITAEDCAQLGARWDGALCHPVRRDCLAWARFYNGGLAFYGGLGVGAWAGWWIVRRDGLPFRALCDVTAVGLALGLAVGRIGCLLAGCCFGAPTELPLGVRFPPHSPASEAQFRAGQLAGPGLTSLPVHPTQLYEALGCSLLALLLWRSRARFAGRTALLGLLGYAGLRFVIELARADDRGMWRGLSTAQWLGLAIAAGSFALWRRWAREPQP